MMKTVETHNGEWKVPRNKEKKGALAAKFVKSIKWHIGDGMVALLNTAAGIPFIKKELVYEIEENILR